jgi:CubicO group peptidase (beta-lactamase class C family)
MKARSAILIILITTLINTTLTNTSLAQANTDALKASLLRDVPVLMAEYHVPCVGVGLIDSGRVAWIKVFGDLQKGHPAVSNTLFNIASQTKPVVAMLTLKLVQAGNWDLDEPLAHYWIDPDLADDPYLQKLTTRYVLSHQTGFPNWRTDNGAVKLHFNFEPGTRFGYSGEGYEYLRRALERKFRQPLNKLLDSILLKPLGMNDTRYWADDLDTGRFAMWHDGRGNRYGTSIQTPVNAADDLITTIGDYCRFGIAVMNGLGLSDTLFADMIRPQINVKEDYYRGLGWGLVKNLPNGEYALEHGGSDIGVRTMAIFLPKSGTGIVLMTNGDNGMFITDRIIKQALAPGAKILGIMNKGQTTHSRITLPDAIIQNYTGSYRQSNGKSMQVIKKGNAIQVSGDGLPTAELFPESINKFFLEGYDVQIAFPDTLSLIVFEGGKQVMKLNKVLTGRKDTIQAPLKSTQGRLKKFMTGIASNPTEGRFTGSAGYLRAANYTVSQLKKAGLQPGWTEKGQKTFLQPVPFTFDNYDGSLLTITKNKYETKYTHSAATFIVQHPGAPTHSLAPTHSSRQAPVFIGYGIHAPQKGWDDYAGIDVTGRWVILLNGVPPDLQQDLPVPDSVEALKYQALLRHRVAGVLLLPDEYTAKNWETTVIRQRRFGYMHYVGDGIAIPATKWAIPCLLVRPDLAKKLFAGESYDPMTSTGVYHPFLLTKTHLTIRLDARKEHVNSYNIIALAPGKSEELHNETILVGAHLDHIGRVGNHIYNGANDDASGCAVALEAAGKIAAHPCKRPVLFVFYTGEELNLKGSHHFVNHPPLPLDHLLMNINLEQVGSKHRSFNGMWAVGDPVFKDAFYQSGSAFPGKDLKYTPTDSLLEEISNTDSYSFINKQVPSLLLSSGGFDEHHSILDTIDLIDFDHLQKVAALLTDMVIDLGNK